VNILFAAVSVIVPPLVVNKVADCLIAASDVPSPMEIEMQMMRSQFNRGKKKKGKRKARSFTEPAPLFYI
jgi:hypothetical protein